MELIDYYQRMIEKTENPNHKRYYKKMLLGLNGNQQMIEAAKESRSCNKSLIYSKVLNKTFTSATEACAYLNKHKAYVTNCLSGLTINKYEFEKL